MHLKTRSLILCLSFSLIFTSISFSQKTEDIIGDWKVVKVELSSSADEEEKENIEILKQPLLKWTFHFKSGNSFSLESPDKDIGFKEGIWKFDENRKYIDVTQKVSKGTGGQLMGISVKVQNGTYLFLMDETPVILTVTKK